MHVIARPEASRAALFVKLPALEIAQGAQVLVDEGDAVVFVRNGAALGMLGAGSYRVDPASAPFFASLAAGARADVIFVKKSEHGWWSMSAEPYALTDGRTGALVQVRFTGSFSVEVHDPRAFATTMVVQDEKWLWAYVESVVDRACRDVAGAMMREGLGVADLAQEHGARALAQRTVADVSGDLASQPIRVVRFGSLLVQVL
jgi:membrane protease subunit (stomatin/prohibitin family)